MSEPGLIGLRGLPGLLFTIGKGKIEVGGVFTDLHDIMY